jgi:hypothetical protein
LSAFNPRKQFRCKFRVREVLSHAFTGRYPFRKPFIRTACAILNSIRV